MPKAATHTGSCQCCGKWHKLPDGLLAKHGYQVLWNHFADICRGSGELPFEESCSLIEQFVEEAEAHRATLEVQRTNLLQPATQPIAWYREYVSWTRTRKSGYQWRQIELFVDNQDVIRYTNIDEKIVRLDDYTYGMSLLDVATMLNERRAKALEADIQKIAMYIQWQNERVAAWQPGELKPLGPTGNY